MPQIIWVKKMLHRLFRIKGAVCEVHRIKQEKFTCNHAWVKTFAATAVSLCLGTYFNGSYKVALSEQLSCQKFKIDDDNVVVLSDSSKNKVITLIGTAHTSQQSVELVREAIKSLKPDSVVIELDCKRIGYLVTTSNVKNVSQPQSETRDASLNNTPATQRKLIRSPTVDHKMKKVASAVEPMGALLSRVFQSLRSVGFTSGSEFKTAVEEAFEVGAAITLGDRDIDITLRRLALAIDATDKDRFIAAAQRISELIDSSAPSSAADTHTSSKTLGGALTQREAVAAIVQVIREELPLVCSVLIDERDCHIANSVLHSSGQNIVVVVGLAHFAGVQSLLQSEGGLDILC